ncbi:hypothetical protein [Rhizobium etli]|nr:hypothetical protein [Rhizobium etli]
MHKANYGCDHVVGSTPHSFGLVRDGNKSIEIVAAGVFLLEKWLRD